MTTITITFKEMPNEQLEIISDMLPSNSTVLEQLAAYDFFELFKAFIEQAIT